MEQVTFEINDIVRLKFSHPLLNSVNADETATVLDIKGETLILDKPLGRLDHVWIGDVEHVTRRQFRIFDLTTSDVPTRTWMFRKHPGAFGCLSSNCIKLMNELPVGGELRIEDQSGHRFLVIRLVDRSA